MATERRVEPWLSVVIPFFDEEETLPAVCAEVTAVLDAALDRPWELILVDDGSRDRTGELADAFAAARPGRCRVLHLRPNSGQSAALEAGFRAARGAVIATLDGDGQNDPADIPRLLRAMAETDVDLMGGVRARRADDWLRRVSSRIANRVRDAVLHDGVTDVGCSLRVFRREVVDGLPLFRHAHRFLPALAQAAGWRVAERPVGHRPRAAGRSKYGRGINSRLWVGLLDLWGVWWLRRRLHRYAVTDEAGRRVGGSGRPPGEDA